MAVYGDVFWESWVGAHPIGCCVLYGPGLTVVLYCWKYDLLISASQMTCVKMLISDIKAHDNPVD